MARARNTASECSNSLMFGNETGKLQRKRANRSMSPDSSSVSHTVATCDAVKLSVGNANSGLGARIGWWWWWWWWCAWFKCGAIVGWFVGVVGIGAGGLLPSVPPRPTAIEGRTTARLLNIFGAILSFSTVYRDSFGFVQFVYFSKLIVFLQSTSQPKSREQHSFFHTRAQVQ